MIKLAVRRNLIYPLQLLLWNNVRDLESALISHFFNVNNFLIYTGLMFTGEILAGLLFYLYQNHHLKKETTKEATQQLNTIEYIYTERFYNDDIDKRDKKSYFLIMISGFCDISQFFISLQFHKFINISGTLERRLRANYTINNAFIYYFILKLPILKHQSLSLIIFTICLVTIVIIEFIF